MAMISKFFKVIQNISNKTNKTKPTLGIESTPEVNFGVNFDSSGVTQSVKVDIRKNVELLDGITPEHFDQIYDAALRSVMTGRDVRSLTIALMAMNIEGMTKQRASEIALNLNNKASAIMTREQQLRLGFYEAVWLHSHAGRQPRESHIAADGKRYKVAEGMFLDGKWTWPGYEDGCLCFSKSILPGFEERPRRLQE